MYDLKLFYNELLNPDISEERTPYIFKITLGYSY
jgi:hypothetical protein